MSLVDIFFTHWLARVINKQIVEKQTAWVLSARARVTPNQYHDTDLELSSIRTREGYTLQIRTQVRIWMFYPHARGLHSKYEA